MLTFNAERHEYQDDGVIVPHVTGVISDLTDYSMIGPERLEIARQKGTAVHRMIELHSKGELGKYDLPEWIQPCLAEWEKFVAQTGFKMHAAECPLYHPRYKFATTPDLIGTMRSMEGYGIIEVKRSFLAGKAIGLQTAAQAAAWNANNDAEHQIKWRGAIKINENNAYRFEEHKDETDWQKFVACLVHSNLLKECRS